VFGLEDLTRTCGWAVLDFDDDDDDGCELLCLKGCICVVFVFTCAGDGHVVFFTSRDAHTHTHP